MAEAKRTAEEKALIEKAQAFKEEFKLARWGQREHGLFLLRIAREHGLPDAGKAPFLAEINRLGLGANCSQFAQACGFRAAKGTDEADAMLALL